MFRKPPRLAVALAATAAACLLVATTADAAVHRRILRVRFKPVFAGAQVRPGYVGAAGYPYGPPGPIRPMLVDIPPNGFFTPTGAIGYGQAVVVGSISGVPTLVPNAVGLGTGFATDVVGAGTYLVGGGVGYVTGPLR